MRSGSIDLSMEISIVSICVSIVEEVKEVAEKEYSDEVMEVEETKEMGKVVAV